MLKLTIQSTLMLSMGNFDRPTQNKKLSNTSKQSRSRSTKIAIFSNHVDQNLSHSPK